MGSTSRVWICRLLDSSNTASSAPRANTERADQAPADAEPDRGKDVLLVTIKDTGLNVYIVTDILDCL
jgi:hypothetical protein